MSAIREFLSCNTIWMMLKAIDQLWHNQIFGTEWINEPGVVMMYSFETKQYEPFHYTHWLERPMFLGKYYKRVGKV